MPFKCSTQRGSKRLRWLKQGLKSALNFVLPLQCLNCRGFIGTNHALCPICWSQFNFVNPPQCHSCGRPFTIEVDKNLVCGACLKKDEPWSERRYAFAYTAETKGIILNFKHHDATHLSKAFGQFLAQPYNTFDHPHDFIIPVPLHWTRLFVRRYNQAALLAQALSFHIHVPALLTALKRLRRTPSQGTLTSHARAINVKNAFTIASPFKDLLKGKSVLLVDDVFTTGATVRNCTQTLLNAGALRVDVLTLAAVLKEEEKS
jgi:ComF family protein